MLALKTFNCTTCSDTGEYTSLDSCGSCTSTHICCCPAGEKLLADKKAAKAKHHQENLQLLDEMGFKVQTVFRVTFDAIPFVTAATEEMAVESATNSIRRIIENKKKMG